MMRSEWLLRAERDGGECGVVEKNGGSPVCVVRLGMGCARRYFCDVWALRLLYAPLVLLRRFPLRCDKYYWATVSSVHMIEEAFGGRATRVRHLHRHSVLTCYLDALVDTSDDIAWPLGFGLAVFGMRESPPGFLPSHDEEFRDAVRMDYPRLRLAAAGEHKDLIVTSLLEAARVEGQKRCVPHREHKLLSNLVCIRPFIVSGGMMDASMMEPLAMVYTFFDDALDVLEDLEAGVETHMATEAGVRRSASLVRRAISELNARAVGGLDWSELGELAVRVATGLATVQIKDPSAYRAAESSAPSFCASAVAFIFVIHCILREAR
jgi:hypothetical protein